RDGAAQEGRARRPGPGNGERRRIGRVDLLVLGVSDEHRQPARGGGGHGPHTGAAGRRDAHPPPVARATGAVTAMAMVRSLRTPARIRMFPPWAFSMVWSPMNSSRPC